MYRPLVIFPAPVVSQQEHDDVAEIASLFASNTQEHLTTVRNLRNEVRAEARLTSPALTQRLNINVNW